MSTPSAFDKPGCDVAWCPGCGNFRILEAIKQALSELGKRPQEVVVVSGIGQAPKTPHYFHTNMFNGLHGRALPAAVGVKAANPSLTVIAEGGDGDMYGEGGNHFLHTIRRNPDITHIVHTNMVYGLTKGQASPTSQLGFKTSVQVDGVISEPVNPLAIALAADASFVARAFTGDVEQTREIIKKAILHKGYALVDILQPCVTYNKINTFRWFKENSYWLDASYSPTDRAEAFRLVAAPGKMPLGIIYASPRTTFEQNLAVYQRGSVPLWQRSVDMGKLRDIMDRKRTA
jgi:2-oxoglutarate/2-oxoacid ferredoxin oxidoreductase subunit beta